ncbi:uncharacterized protein LTR77_001304 [Saxophila tyrrhenica]|uniref:Uncharacterized protein n=1 Tax=Saxophila tyrrhenica TaxID=1690608 RepID=A0AAV9PL49_9PEZI|nr:hypothetical protein LTR77_001304 [Saxophila tyrrhenica]
MLPRAFGRHEGSFWSLLSSKPSRSALTFVLAAILVAVIWRSSRPETENALAGITPVVVGDFSSEGQQEVVHATKGRLHLLIPATSSGPDLCKLLLSAQILGYPTPVLINFDDPEDLEDPYKQHIAKVGGFLEYLEQLQASSEYAEDLVLIVDGYDIWFQLPPEVLIKRYYALNGAADDRMRKTYGDATFEAQDMRQTIIFGPDKLCWPVDYSRPACWAVPEATLPDYAFGPETSRIHIDMFMPRWLNSGTVFGPVKDVRDLFNSTLEAIHTKYETDSDQFYFANIFGEQEYARLTHRPELLLEAKSKRIGIEWNYTDIEIVRNEPQLDPANKTEYHIGIDYESTAFQTVAFYKQFLIFMRPEDSWEPERTQVTFSRPQTWRPHVMQLPDDIRHSRPPFHALASSDDASTDAMTSWSEVELLYNPLTGQIPVSVHFTGSGEKALRRFWWQRLWFQTRASELRQAARKLDGEAISGVPINGLTWYNAEPQDAQDISFNGRGGAWSDDGGWFSWNKLCKPHEEHIFEIMNEEYYHAPPKEEKEEQEDEEEDDEGEKPDEKPEETVEDAKPEPEIVT